MHSTGLADLTPGLIAYPLLEGDPIAVVDPAGGGYVWRFSQESLSDTFLDSLATTLATLHNIDPDKAKKGGVRIKTPMEARKEFAANIEEVKQNFTVPTELVERWTVWLSISSYWPQHSAFIHGDLHPPHIIVDDDQRVTGLIDWTEAEIADPGKDFVIYYALFQEDGLRELLSRYEKAGGRTWPQMLEHIREQWQRIWNCCQVCTDYRKGVRHGDGERHACELGCKERLSIKGIYSNHTG